ncbi:hypothetical protein SAMD00019534_117150 [Acytostelium subglobosum LB1]|uniref:hypothetical protein n=1 Tax=Acytostelium subglobosum LB1 TaxID=1410327 RepID=UPI000644C241|nr:hypothetical protein SAMD00019534_117150 [Acytostelium subglobosum LB1]GAM28539.1 hypothetical protein SAMD00019534_117150 [Acytostelium subglobosum LB1]|eukprot:XP_012748578.1 hypothetical protein SAMD00019534_117150 [Acytostelium subglobosum LB1]
MLDVGNLDAQIRSSIEDMRRRMAQGESPINPPITSTTSTSSSSTTSTTSTSPMCLTPKSIQELLESSTANNDDLNRMLTLSKQLHYIVSPIPNNVDVNLILYSLIIDRSKTQRDKKTNELYIDGYRVQEEPTGPRISDYLLEYREPRAQDRPYRPIKREPSNLVEDAINCDEDDEVDEEAIYVKREQQ